METKKKMSEIDRYRLEFTTTTSSTGYLQEEICDGNPLDVGFKVYREILTCLGDIKINFVKRVQSLTSKGDRRST